MRSRVRKKIRRPHNRIIPKCGHYMRRGRCDAPVCPKGLNACCGKCPRKKNCDFVCEEAEFFSLKHHSTLKKVARVW